MASFATVRLSTRVKGKSEGDVARLLGCTIADVRQAVDAQADATLSAQNRVRMIYLQLQRIEELKRFFASKPWAGGQASRHARQRASAIAT